MKPLLVVSATLLATVSAADDDFAKFLSNEGFYGFLAAGVLTPELKGDRPYAIRTADSLLSTYIVNTGLKRAFRVPRIQGQDNDSFPSGHSAGAFCIATMASERDPKGASYWYAGASLIAWSRVQTEAHRLPDVVAGAIVGHLIAKAELRSHSPFLLRFQGDQFALQYAIKF